MVGDAGGDHARGDRIVVENLTYRADVAHHRHPSLVNEPKKRRSRHLDSFCDIPFSSLKA